MSRLGSSWPDDFVRPMKPTMTTTVAFIHATAIRFRRGRRDAARMQTPSLPHYSTARAATPHHQSLIMHAFSKHTPSCQRTHANRSGIPHTYTAALQREILDSSVVFELWIEELSTARRCCRATRVAENRPLHTHMSEEHTRRSSSTVRRKKCGEVETIVDSADQPPCHPLQRARGNYST